MSAVGRLLLGVDGGASKTVALVVDEDGRVLGAARAGSSDIHGATGPAAAVAAVAGAVRRATASAGVTPDALAVGVFCVCGADWPEDDDHYRAALTEQLALTADPVVMNDSFAALRAGTPDGLGVALVLGTGAAIAARGPSGRSWFSGFRIEAAGALELGRQVHESLIRGTWGPGPVPGFERAALDTMGVASVEAFVHALSRVGGPQPQGMARLAPVLLEAGHRGDPTACAIIQEHGRMLAGYVAAAVRRVGLHEQGPTIVLSGGLLRHPCTDLVDAIAAGLPGCLIVRPTVEPVFGAVLLAADEVGLTLDTERLWQSGPGSDFFETL